MLLSRVLVTTCTVAASTLVVANRARADQFVAFDLAYEHSDATSTYSHHWVAPPASAPPSLVAPIDYSKGTIHYYMEVFTKPSAEPTMFHNCFGTSPHYICGPYSPKYTKTGTYEWSANVSAASYLAMADLTLGFKDKTSFIITDGGYNNVGKEDTGGAAKSKLFLPTQLRVVVTWVSAGGTYVRPTASAMPPVSSDGGVVAVSDASAPKSEPDAGAPRPEVDASSPPPAAPPASTAPGSLPGKPVVSPDAATDDEVPAVSPTPRSSSGGCAIATQVPGPLAWIVPALAWVGLAMRRRRTGVLQKQDV